MYIVVGIKVYAIDCHNSYSSNNDTIAFVNNDSVVYFKNDGEILNLRLNEVIYNEGMDSLKKAIYNGLEYEHEDNSRAIIFVLFDEYLRIHEIRICDLHEMINQHNSNRHNNIFLSTHKRYVRDYLQSIRKTQYMWRRKNKSLSEWYIAMFSIYIV